MNRDKMRTTGKRKSITTLYNGSFSKVKAKVSSSTPKQIIQQELLVSDSSDEHAESLPIVQVRRDGALIMDNTKVWFVSPSGRLLD